MCELRRSFIAILFFLSISLYAFGQDQIRLNVANVPRSSFSTIEKPFIPTLSKYNRIPDYSNLDIEFFRLDQKFSNQILNSKNEFISFSISTFEEDFQFLLYEVELLSSNYFVHSSRGDILLGDRMVKFYHGIVDGQKSLVSLSVHRDHIKIYISIGKRQLEVSKMNDGSYAIYDLNSIEDRPGFYCSSELLENDAIPESKNISSNRSMTGDCVEIYVETDFESYQDNNSSLSDTEEWILDIFNEVSMLYSDENIPIVISEIKIWDEVDPYADLNSTIDVLYEFDDQAQDNYNGRLAHWISTRSLGGGVAWLDVLCANYNPNSNYGPYGVSASLSTNVVPVPTYSWTVEVVTHELGHNFGSPHTHACAWNGNNTAIDGCGPEAGYSEGCDADLPEAGTIMSYCHLVGGVGIDFNLGFGDQPGDLIFDEFVNASCNTGDECGDLPPLNNDCDNAFTLSVDLVCQASEYDNEFATASGELPSISCGLIGDEKDVWFSFQGTVSGTAIVETVDVVGGLSDLILEVYSGSCGSLVFIDCDDNSGSGNHAKVELSGLNQGETYLVRLIESGSDEEGTYGICVYDENLTCDGDFDLLIELYNSTNGANWDNNSGWVDGVAGTNCDYCQWYGVSCNGNGEVIGIDLDHNSMSGTVPLSLSQITTLEVIDFWDNNLNDPFPVFWDQLPDITFIDLSNNNYTDPLPSNLSALLSAETMWLENNNSTGEIPTGMGDIASLDIFFLNNNNLSGCIPLDLSSKCALQYVDFDGNSNLPGGGDKDAFCNNGDGGDEDMDGYCKGTNPGEDCDDINPDINPDGIETCDNIDNNCDGQIDEGMACFGGKVILGGCYNGDLDLMNDDLRQENLIPLLEPYTDLGYIFIGGGLEEILDPDVFLLDNENAIVDWLLIEIRSKLDSTIIIHSRAALLQRDGDIVEVDGVSEIDLDFLVDDDYYISINHRNHLGIMTKDPIDLSGNIDLDFTSILTETYGESAREMLEIDVYGLWPGDVNADGIIKYNGSSNDKNSVLFECGLFTPNNVVSTVYDSADINMDGDVQYNGSSNDKNEILSRVGLFTPNNIIEEQLPEM